MIRTHRRHLYLLWVYVGLFFGVGFSQTIYVWTNGVDINNGTSPATSVRTIQVGITKAIQNGWTDVRISQGFYVPSAGLNASAVGRGVLITNDNLQIRADGMTPFPPKAVRPSSTDRVRSPMSFSSQTRTTFSSID